MTKKVHFVSLNFFKNWFHEKTFFSGHVETGVDGFGRWTIDSQKKWMVGCAIFNTATLTILLANFGPYGNFINGIEHEPREEFRDYSYLRISSKVKKKIIELIY